MGRSQSRVYGVRGVVWEGSWNGEPGAFQKINIIRSTKHSHCNGTVVLCSGVIGGLHTRPAYIRESLSPFTTTPLLLDSVFVFVFEALRST